MALQEYYGHGLPPSIENHRMISYPKELGLIDGFKLNPEANIYFKDIKDVNLNELDSIWEERETSEYDLAFPKDLETITILK